MLNHVLSGPERYTVSVILRSYNDADLLPRTLQALHQQQGINYELIVMESASTDESPDILRREQPAHFVALSPGSYWSSSVLNRAMRLAQNEFVILLNSDAIMTSNDVILELCHELAKSERCVGTYARQIVRPDAQTMTRIDYHRAFGQPSASLQQPLSLVCSAVRRSAWLSQPFDQRLTFAEDAAWSQRQHQAGLHTYCARRSAEHSHNYTFTQRLKRAFGDAAALALHQPHAPARTMLGGVIKPLLRRWIGDSILGLRMRRPQAMLISPWYRLPQLLGGLARPSRCATTASDAERSADQRCSPTCMASALSEPHAWPHARPTLVSPVFIHGALAQTTQLEATRSATSDAESSSDRSPRSSHETQF